MIGIVVLHVDNTLQRKLTFRLSWTYMISSNIALAKSWLLLFLKNLLERRKDDDAWRRNMTGSPAELGSCWKGLTLWENILNQMVKENMMGQFFKKKNISHSSIFTSKYGACAYIPKQTLLDIQELVERKKELQAGSLVIHLLTKMYKICWLRPCALTGHLFSAMNLGKRAFSSKIF